MANLIRGIRSFLSDPGGQSLIAVTSVIVGIGTVFYRFVEDLTWLDSVYFSVITLTTVGYGDFSPTTNAGKVFTMGYVLAGIGIFVAVVTEIGVHLVDAQKENRKQRKTQ